MKLSPELESIAALLKSAAARQDFDAAALLAGRFAVSLRAAAELVPLQSRIELVDEGRRVLENARRRLCVARARLAGRLDRLEKTSGYRTTAPGAIHTWSVSA